MSKQIVQTTLKGSHSNVGGICMSLPKRTLASYDPTGDSDVDQQVMMGLYLRELRTRLRTLTAKQKADSVAVDRLEKKGPSKDLSNARRRASRRTETIEAVQAQINEVANFLGICAKAGRSAMTRNRMTTGLFVILRSSPRPLSAEELAFRLSDIGALPSNLSDPVESVRAIILSTPSKFRACAGSPTKYELAAT